MAETSNPGGVVQTQRWFFPGTEKDRLPPSTAYTTRPRATRTNLEKPLSPVRNRKDATGWRSPSGYKLLAYSSSEFFGTLKLVNSNSLDSVFEYNDCYIRDSYLADSSRWVPTVTQNMENRAIVECYGKLKDLNVNYAVALAESRKSIGMISQNFFAVVDAYRHAKKRRWEKAAKSLGVSPPGFKKSSKDVSGRWLELQYGWLPLLSDAYGAYEDARKGILWRTPRISVSRVIAQQCPDWDGDVGSGLKASYTHSEGSKYGVKVRLDYQLKSDALSAASNIGLTNPLVVAWELVPFSFVVDWAVPIGNWLESFDADFGLTFKGGSKTRFVRVKRTGKIAFSRSGRRAYSAHYAFLESSFEYFSMERIALSSPPLPVPYWKNPISTAHALNALALLRALFK